VQHFISIAALRAAFGEVMAKIPDIQLGDARMQWRPVAPSTASPEYGEHEDEAPTSYADDDEHPPEGLGQGRSRVLRFALGIFIAALIGSGSAVAWRTYSDPTTPVPGPPSGPMSPVVQASGPMNPVQAPQRKSNVENSQNSPEIPATLQADKDAIIKLETAQQTQAQQLSEQLTQLRNQIAGLQAEVAAGRELQTSQQAELQRLSGALAAQKAAQKKAQAARPKQPRDGDQAAGATAPASAQRPPAPPTTGGPMPLR